MLKLIREFVRTISKYIKSFVNYFKGYNDRLIQGDLTLEELRFLIDEREVDVNITEGGYNALHAALVSTPFHKGCDIFKEKIDILLRAGVDPNKQGDVLYLNAPLHGIIANENAEGTLYFINQCNALSKPLRYDVVDVFKATPLILAAKVRNEAIGLHILAQRESHASINFQDILGMTALHYAAMFGQTALFGQLLLCGADTTITNGRGKTCYDMLNGDREFIKAALQSIEINPERDENARSNEFQDRNYRKLAVRGKMLKVRNGTSAPITPVSIASESKNVKTLMDYLKEPAKLIDSSAYVYDNAIEPITDASKQFIRQQCAQFTGRSLLEKCVAGQKEIQRKYNKPK